MGDVQEIDPGEALEHLAREMRAPADPGSEPPAASVTTPAAPAVTLGESPDPTS